MKRTVKRMVSRLLGRPAHEGSNDPSSPARAGKKQVRRIADRAPQGEWIDPAEVTEFSQDTMPSAFYDDTIEPHAPSSHRKRS